MLGLPGRGNLLHTVLESKNSLHGRLGILHSLVHHKSGVGALNLTHGLCIGAGEHTPVLCGVGGFTVCLERCLQILQIGLLNLAEGRSPHRIEIYHSTSFTGQALNLSLIGIAHRTTGCSGPTSKLLALFGEGVGLQRNVLAVGGSHGLDLPLTAVGVQLDGVLIGCPLGVEGNAVAVGLTASQVQHLSAVCIVRSIAAGLRVPLGESVTVALEGRAFGQRDLAVPLGRHTGNGTIAAIGGEIDGILVGNPPAVQGLSCGLKLSGCGSLELGSQEPGRPVMAIDGVLLLVVVQIDDKARLIGQVNLLHEIVPRHKAAALQLGVVTHIQLREPVMVDVQEGEIFKLAYINGGQMVVKGLNEYQLGVVSQIQAGQQVVPAIHRQQVCASGQRQAGQQVHLTVQGD